MKQTNDNLVTYVKNCLKLSTRYAWGGLMRLNTGSYCKQLTQLYPAKNNYSRLMGTDTVYLCDCIGLIKSFTFGGVGSPDYDPGRDYSTNSALSASVVSGHIDNIGNVPGRIVYMPGHVGVFIGSGEVVECTLGKFGDGVVKTKLSDRPWTSWFEYPGIVYNKPVDQNGEALDKLQTHLDDMQDILKTIREEV